MVRQAWQKRQTTLNSTTLLPAGTGVLTSAAAHRAARTWLVKRDVRHGAEPWNTVSILEPPPKSEAGVTGHAPRRSR